jgi:hypothetical protein
MSPEDTQANQDPTELTDRLRELRTQFDELRRRL